MADASVLGQSTAAIETLLERTERDENLGLGIVPRRRRMARAGLVAAGLGDQPMSACRPTCKIRCSLGEWRVRTPVLQFNGAT